MYCCFKFKDENSIKKYFDYFPSIQKGLNLFGSSNSLSFSNINSKIKSVLGESSTNINKEHGSTPRNVADQAKSSNTHSNFDLNIISATPQLSINNLYSSTYFNVSDNDESLQDFNSPDSPPNLTMNHLSMSQRSASPFYSMNDPRMYTSSLSPSILQQAILGRDQYLGNNSKHLSLTADASRMASPASDISDSPRIFLSPKNFNKLQETGMRQEEVKSPDDTG